jgi:hypothetical protein
MLGVTTQRSFTSRGIRHFDRVILRFFKQHWAAHHRRPGALFHDDFCLESTFWEYHMDRTFVFICQDLLVRMMGMYL